MSFLTPLKKAPRKYPLWGFDIETYSDKNLFLMGSIVGDGNIKKSFWGHEEMIRFIKDNARLRGKGSIGFNKGYIAATNLGFDILALLEDSSCFEDIIPICRNSRMIYVKLPIDAAYSRENSCGVRNVISSHGSIKFIDTFNYAPFSVERWGKLLGIPKLPKPEFLGKRPSCKSEKDELIAYNFQDSLITYKAMKFLQDGFNNQGAELKITAASTAMNLFRRRYLKENYYHPNDFMLSYIHDGYYGGRTEAIIRGPVKNLKYYDINSMYPDVMRNSYPFPNKFYMAKSLKMRELMELEGMAKVRITAPYMHIPYLPYRFTNKDKEEKLIFPTGTFDGCYTFFELRQALALGYKIEKIDSALVYPKTFIPFREFVDILYKERLRYLKEGSSLDVVAKLLMNSLYGKFGQKNDLKETIVHGNKVTMKMLGDAKYFERTGNFFILKNEADDIPSFANPIFSAYTTAYARDKLYRYASRCKDSFYYCDTDSFITKKDFECSSALGDIKKVMDIREGIIVKPKMYRFDEIAKCKGLRIIDSADFMKILERKQGRVRKFIKFKEANRRGLKYNAMIEFYKLLNLEDDKRTWPSSFSIDEIQDSSPLGISV